ncbi:hypothetical protein L486_05690 [Kwoniella mangroviensis CBS 10435]|uniref:CREG-like beta-barrel domain-containing protein n=1 Tax=Kwoniella mangroviensis CBS 10435 TaxID=1331196 RepID=A0A1B9IMP0_9TREE|nr:uncharacterized protein I203_07338 [Kwoniella mangroviensis CBS 8507]OCF56835.1 hypothetical protein L486_05690 [Kwoniella mangroviensis CBS 10435]OCF63640.1 hypothetical protein I203_07338 [Kwoniella mangroviensis CBS 8507]
MHFQFLLSLLTLTSVLGLSVPSPDQLSRRETLEEAAHNARVLVKDVKTGTLASVFPNMTDLAGRPFAMMEYHAPCYSNGSLTLILMPISRSTQNIFQNPGHHAAYTVSMPTEGVRSPMSRGRVALMGNVTTLRDISSSQSEELAQCYTIYHPDSKYWLPGNDNSPHTSYWARLDIDRIYYVGGFGDIHYIGAIPVDLYAKSENGVQQGYEVKEKDDSEFLRIQNDLNDQVTF